MIKQTITVVLEIEGAGDPLECDDDLQRILDDSDIHLMVGPDSVVITVTDFREGDKLAEKPQHFSDRELIERGLPPFAWADDGMGNVIRIERGMMGFFPADPYTVAEVDKLNKAFKVTPAQAEAMHIGSMVGWHCAGRVALVPREEGGNVKSPYEDEEVIVGRLVSVIQFARQRGYDVRIETKPKTPLAMGNHMPSITVTPNNKAYRKPLP